MTRKDYQAFADILWSIRYAVTPEIHEHLVDEMAKVFKTDNERFDFNRFAQACGLEL
jgi:hypothetical protein